MGSELSRYEAACRAVAEAKSVDEVKDLLDKSEAMRIYARQAKNRDLEADASEIRLRAERRLGEMIAHQKATVGLNSGGWTERNAKSSGSKTEPQVSSTYSRRCRYRQKAQQPSPEASRRP